MRGDGRTGYEVRWVQSSSDSITMSMYLIQSINTRLPYTSRSTQQSTCFRPKSMVLVWLSAKPTSSKTLLNPWPPETDLAEPGHICRVSNLVSRISPTLVTACKLGGLLVSCRQASAICGMRYLALVTMYVSRQNTLSVSSIGYFDQRLPRSHIHILKSPWQISPSLNSESVRAQPQVWQDHWKV